MPLNGNNYKYFKIDKNVHIYAQEEFMDKKNKKLKKILLGINKRFNIAKFRCINEKIKTILYSKSELKRYISFINTQKFDIVVGVNGLYSILVGMISDDIDSATIGWQHSTFNSYFNRRGKSLYGLKEMGIEYYRKLNEVLVLTHFDKRDFDTSFNIKSKVFYNPLPEIEHGFSNLSNNSLIFVGRLDFKHKGLEYLIEILKKVLENDKSIKCLIVGDGPDKEKLLKLIKRAKIGENVIFIGKSDNVYQYYESADVLLQTSRWEGFGMTIIEAMSCGLPVISFHNYGPDEIIRDNKDGYLINKYDINDFSSKIIGILNNKYLKKTFSKSAIERSEQFELSVALNEFESLLDKLTDKEKQK